MLPIILENDLFALRNLYFSSIS